VTGSNIAVVEAFFAAWADGADAMNASFHEHFTPDTVWENVGMATTVGPDEAVAFLRRGEASWDRDAVTVEMLAVAEVGDKVLTERIDRGYDRAGRLVWECPVMGTIELADGKVTAWREYFDAASITASRPAGT
jgi:limonene-1,2-epoxide hydrolase